jgi:hypothetical protein
VPCSLSVFVVAFVAKLEFGGTLRLRRLCRQALAWRRKCLIRFRVDFATKLELGGLLGVRRLYRQALAWRRKCLIRFRADFATKLELGGTFLISPPSWSLAVLWKTKKKILSSGIKAPAKDFFMK